MSPQDRQIWPRKEAANCEPQSRTLLLVRAEAAVLGGELLCHRFGDDVDVVGNLPEGTYDRPRTLPFFPYELS